MCCEYTVGKCPPQERDVLCTGNAQAWGRSEPGQGYTDGSALGDVTTLQVSMPSFKIFVMRVYISCDLVSFIIPLHFAEPAIGA